MESTTKEKNHNIIKALLLTINGIAIFAGVFVLISLLFPLVSYKVNVFGYNYGSVSENAYQFLRFYSVIVNKDWIIAHHFYTNIFSIVNNFKYMFDF